MRLNGGTIRQVQDRFILRAVLFFYPQDEREKTWYNRSIKNNLPHIGIWDLESSRMTIKSFNRHPDYIPTDDIVDDTFLICGAVKTLGKHKIYSFSTLDNLKRLKKNPRDDYEVVKKLRDVIASYDILIHFNGDKFDLPLLRSKIMYYHLPPLPRVKTIDLYKELKTQSPTSASLDWSAKMAGIEQKPHMGKALWAGCEIGDIKSLKKMISYCRHDVKMTEAVYNYYKPYIKNSPVEKFSRLPECPHCHLNSLTKKKRRMNAQGKMGIQYQCKTCGKHITKYD